MFKEGPEEVPVERRKSSPGIEIDTGGGVSPRSRCLCPREATKNEVGRAGSTCRSGLLQKTSASKGSHGRFVKRLHLLKRANADSTPLRDNNKHRSISTHSQNLELWSRDGPKGDGPNFYSVDLESQLASELPPAWQRLAGYLSKVSCTQIGLDILEIRMVEQVEELEPHLKVKLLRDVCVLVNRCVRLHESRVTELSRLLVALGNAGWRSELPRREDTSGVSTA